MSFAPQSPVLHKNVIDFLNCSSLLMAISTQLFPPMVQMAILVQNSSSKETFYENMDKIRRVEEGLGGWGGGVGGGV
jgi:hypothetical protein